MRSVRLPLLFAALVAAGCPDLPDTEPTDLTDGIAGADDVVEGPGEETILDLPPCSFSVINAFTAEEVQPPEAGSEGWMPPEADTLAAIEASADALLSMEPEIALGQTAVVGYTMCRGLGEEDRLVLWRPAYPGTGRALFAWRFGQVSDVIIEAPHAWASPATMEQAITLFQSTNARALIAGGSHPCANLEEMGCGADAMCGGDVAPASNPAQNEDTVFHVGHRLFTERFPDSWVVSVVPMDDDGVSVSNGTTGPAAPGSAAEQVGLALMDALADEPVTSCNEFPGAFVEDRACGMDSVQAHHLNGAEEACSSEPLESTGRYVQLSQSAAVQVRGLTIADAIASALGTR
jgi:hypothetical protein